MKSLDALNAELTVEIEARIRKTNDTSILKDLATQRELAELYRQIVVGDKFVQLWDIVNLLDSYLQMPSLDGRMDRQEMRKKLREMIDKI
jgi:hypothetical protein